MVRCLLSGLLLLFVPAAPVVGQILLWDANGAGPPDGTFGVAANWNPDQVPTATDTALFLIDDTYTVTFDDNATSDDLVILDGDLSFLSDSATVRAYGLADLLVQGGTLQVGSESAPVELNVAGGLDIGGSLGDGEVVVSGSDSRLNTNGGTTTVEAGHTLTVEDTSFTTGDLAVNGTLAATGADVIGTVTNNAAGQINVTAGIATLLGATFLGDVINDGTFDISAGAMAVFLGSFGGDNGISGTGTAQFDNELSPGNSTAAIDFGGDLTLGADAVLHVEVFGTTPGDEFDQVNVAGTATLDGTLEIFSASICRCRASRSRS